MRTKFIFAIDVGMSFASTLPCVEEVCGKWQEGIHTIGGKEEEGRGLHEDAIMAAKFLQRPDAI